MSGGAKRLAPVSEPEAVRANRAGTLSSAASIAFGIGLPALFIHGQRPRIILQQETIGKP
ncbi:MAG TPA: hypothetical protein DIT28_01570 [Oxalobacteraceae bacterium]|jgi:hypothetical protein|nr:hypothetical protein [Oxalobacteraceae bacterium]HCN87858.1 hypothetical protein [Oxalobacteraceae bacterium]